MLEKFKNYIFNLLFQKAIEARVAKLMEIKNAGFEILKNQPRPEKNSIMETLLPQYCLLGHFFLSKGDDFLAQRMYLQANISHPANVDVLALEERIIKNKINTKKEESTKNKQRKFDFYVVPFGGGATSLIERLNLRPDVMVALKQDFDEAILKNTYTELLQQYNEKLPTKREDIKVGLVQHIHVGVTPEKEHDEIARNVAKISNHNTFIQTVRDPISYMCSFYNNFILVESGWFDLGLSFKYGNENSIFDGDVFEIKIMAGMPPKIIPPAGKNYVIKQKSCPVINKDELFFAFSSQTKIVKFHELGSIYNRYFKDWLTIDVVAEHTKKKGGDVKKIVEMIGANSHYQLPVYDTISFGLLQRLMWRNWFFVRYKNFSLCFVLGIANWCMGCSTFPYTEVSWAANEELSNLLGLESAIFSLNVSTGMWNSLPLSEQKSLIDSQVFQNILEEIIFPHWMQDYVLWENLTDKFKTNELSAKQLEAMRCTVNDDLSLFLNKHPEYENAWPSVKILFS